MEIYTIQNLDVIDAIECDGYFRPDPMMCMDNTDGYLGYRLCYRWMIDRLYEKCGLPLGITQEEYDGLQSNDDDVYRIGWKMKHPDDEEDEFPQLSLSTPSLMPHPVWAFQKIYDKPHGRPDMRSWMTDEPEEVVRLQLDVPEDRLLFSDMDYWHIPLNMGYFPYGDADEWNREDEKFDARCREAAKQIGINIDYSGELFSDKIDHMFSDSENADIALLQREFLDSWENVFVDTDKLGSTNNPIPFKGLEWMKRETQCVFWEIREYDVRGMEKFTTRRARKS